MSDANILIGYIEEALPTYQEDRTFFRRANDAVLAALPADDEWPPLCRSLFSTTGHDERHGSFRNRRLIHFAGHFNDFGNGINEWLTKYEGLLRQLFWLNSEVFMLHTWSACPMCVQYAVSAEEIEQYTSPAPRPPQIWEVNGYIVTDREPQEGDFVSSILAQRRIAGYGPKFDPR